MDTSFHQHSNYYLFLLSLFDYLQDIRNFLDDFIVLPINNNDVSWAFDNLQGNDFEDALQLACAVNSECDNFVTLDQSLIKRYEKQAPINFITF